MKYLVTFIVEMGLNLKVFGIKIIGGSIDMNIELMIK